MPHDHDNATAREVKESAGCSASVSGKFFGDSQRKLDGAVTFTRFAEKHHRLANAFIRQNPGLLEKSLSMMLKEPRLIDFDNKRAHFRSRIRQQHDHHLSGPLRISVRRAYILEDSYNQLRRRPTQDLKGRLNVQFQGEEGIDAGGLTRECFNEATLQFLDSLLVSKDVKSLIETRSSLKQLLKSESLSIIHSIAVESLHDKLVVLDFFVHAFALVGDLESCVALRYEALVMRDLKSASFQLLQVSPPEWLNFVEDAANNGFHSVAVKACENALWCIGNNDVQKLGRDMFPENSKTTIISEITRIKLSIDVSFFMFCSGASNRVPRKENKRAAKDGLTFQRKTMSSKHFF
ncbi:hypothetical protein RYX36_013720 [Vicia faba]